MQDAYASNSEPTQFRDPGSELDSTSVTGLRQKKNGSNMQLDHRFLFLSTKIS